MNANKISGPHMECVPLSLELGGGVDLVRHDPPDGLVHVVHPFGHSGESHVIDLLDELIVLLPERHRDNLLALKMQNNDAQISNLGLKLRFLTALMIFVM